MAYFRGSGGDSRGRRENPATASSARQDGRGQFTSRRSYAAIDLGTNNCRMLIAKPEGEAFVIVDAFSRIVRLGEGLAASGMLSDVAIDRAVAALSICSTKLARRGVHLSRAVATEACRRASNGVSFVDRVAKETGILLDIIDPEEEARLAVMGCYRMLEAGEGPALIFDIGGGSTELAIIETGKAEPITLDWISIPWGVVSLSEAVDTNLGDEANRLSAYAEMKAKVASCISDFVARTAPKCPDLRLLGTSGTVTTLGSVYLGLASYDRKQVDGLQVPVQSMRDISFELARKSIPERAELPCIGQERADLVVAGCAILEAILDAWPASKVGVADRGIREGILRQLVQMDARR
jgi:exopolyphosphatase / guanosine-5'-triphosphate,3'-diphosphate pyrophosphatase